MTAPSNAGAVLRLSAVELARQIAAGELSATEVCELYLARIDALNPQLNAIIFSFADEARATAAAIDAARRRGEQLGPLAGVPITVKDSFDVVGAPTTIGIGRRRGLKCTTEGPVVERLRRAGAVIVGKTNVPQIMLMYETDNRCFGRTPHPENAERSSGGSSGGEAAAVAGRFAAVGLGSDILGSIRQPAHSCGVHGFKPTMHRTSMIGSLNALRGMEGIISQAGPLARHMSDVTAFARLLLEEPFDDPFTMPRPWREPREVDVGKLRIGVWDDDPMFTPSPAIRRAVREAADALRATGAEVLPFRLPDAEEGFRICVMLLAANSGASARKLLDGEAPVPGVARMLRIWSMPAVMRAALVRTFELQRQPWRAKLLRWARGCGTADYWTLLDTRREYVRRVIAAWRRERLDLILAPPHGLPALRHGTSSDSITSAVYSFVPNLLGLPAGTIAATRVRAGEESDRPTSNEMTALTAKYVEQGSAGLPVGVQVAALPGADDVCLAAMQVLEDHFAKQADYPLATFPGASALPVA
jgi:fatty acid amide hydrolase